MKEQMDWQKVREFLHEIDQVMPPGMLRSASALLPNLRSAHPHELKVAPRAIQIANFDKFEPVSTWFVKGESEQKYQVSTSAREYDYYLRFFFRDVQDAGLFRLLVL